MLYHKDIFIPRWCLAFLCHRWDLAYTTHARYAVVKDKYFSPGLVVPRRIDLTANEIIEVETTGNLVSKAVIRLPASIPQDNSLDLVLVIASLDLDGAAIVKTVWLNLISDMHQTLDTTKYERNPDYHQTTNPWRNAAPCSASRS